MVRLSALRHRHRARFRQAVLPEIRPAGRRAGGVLDLCHRLHRAPVRCSHFRPFWRSRRPQGGADHDLADHRLRHVRGRAGSDLRHDRHLGRGHSHCHPLYPGDRHRRRVGRLGAAGDGMGAHQQSPRPRRLGSAARRAGRVAAGIFRGAVFQLVCRRPVFGLGLAYSVSAQHRHGGRRPLHPPRHP